MISQGVKEEFWFRVKPVVKTCNSACNCTIAHSLLSPDLSTQLPKIQALSNAEVATCSSSSSFGFALPGSLSLSASGSELVGWLGRNVLHQPIPIIHGDLAMLRSNNCSYGLGNCYILIPNPKPLEPVNRKDLGLKQEIL